MDQGTIVCGTPVYVHTSIDGEIPKSKNYNSRRHKAKVCPCFWHHIIAVKVPRAFPMAGTCLTKNHFSLAVYSVPTELLTKGLSINDPVE